MNAKLRKYLTSLLCIFISPPKGQLSGQTRSMSSQGVS